MAENPGGTRPPGAKPETGELATSKRPAPRWWLYIANCDGRLYTGITTDVARRVNEHQRGLARAARFTRAANEVELVYHTPVGDRATALRLERRVKGLHRTEKLALVAEAPSGGTLVRRLLTDA